jgi:fibrillarin-like rRNA methylase
MGHTLGDIHAQLIDTEKAVIEIGGTYGSTLSDVTDRLGSASIYNLEDLFVQLTALTSAVEDLKE